MPARGLAWGETEGLVSGDAGTGVEGIGDAGGDAPGPETAVNVGVGSGRPAGGVEVVDKGVKGGLPNSAGGDAGGVRPNAPPQALPC